MIGTATFRRWIRELRDRAAAAQTNTRLRNASLGNLGDTWAVGDGLFEMRVHHRPGHMLYCMRKADAVVYGGDEAGSGARSSAAGTYQGAGGKEHDGDVHPMGRGGSPQDT